MSTPSIFVQSTSHTDLQMQGYAWDELAPRPKKLRDTGLSLDHVCDLLSKHFLNWGALTLSELVEKLMLPGTVLDEALQFLRIEGRIEVLGASLDRDGLRYQLTEKGRGAALQALMRNGYVGPAPVPVEQYVELVRAQSVHGRVITRDMIDMLFSNVVVDDGLKNQLGLGVNSGRAMFVYGPAGSGKTYLTAKLAKVFADTVLIPHAINIGELTLPIYDPIAHKRLDTPVDVTDDILSLDRGFDTRYCRCERPVIVVGGELLDSMLDVQYSENTKTYVAPLQLKANNGVFIIDDMGRQKVSPEAVFNRWIVPMEEKMDYLTIGSGRHFSIPFDEVLIFSTNLHPLELADEAFLRRIGYKIEFKALEKDEYTRIWMDVCAERGVACDPEVIEFVVNEKHRKTGTPMMACHPRDLIGIAVDYTVYKGEPLKITEDHVDAAWNNYFVSLDGINEQSTNNVSRGNGNV